MALVIENLYKTFDGYVALDRINLSVDKAEFVCLLGPSGCGKTTLLRILIGLEQQTKGQILMDSEGYRFQYILAIKIFIQIANDQLLFF